MDRGPGRPGDPCGPGDPEVPSLSESQGCSGGPTAIGVVVVVLIVVAECVVVLGIIVGCIVVLGVGRNGFVAGLTTGSPCVLKILLLSISFLVTGGILLFVKTEEV